MTRDTTPDLLASMFEKKPAPQKQPAPSPLPPVPAAPKTVRPTTKATPPAAAAYDVEPPIRCTHYLSRDTASRLPMAQGQLLMMTGLKKRDISNSNIVEAALRIMFDDLDEQGAESALVYELLRMTEE